MVQEPYEDVRITLTFSSYSEKVHLLQYSGREKVSRLFEFDVHLAASVDRELDFDQIVGKDALLTIKRGSTTRHLHGMIAYIQLEGAGEKFARYSARLVPRAWGLRYKQDCKVFQEMSVKEIVEKVLAESDVACKTSIQETPRRRDYCVQFRESTWDFVARLMEEEGYLFFFEHAEDSHTLHVVDHYQVHQDIEGDATVPYQPGQGMVTNQEHITDLIYRQGVRSGKVSITDYNFERPGLDLGVDRNAKAAPELEFYEYPGLHMKPEVGKSLANNRLEAYQARRLQGEGHSDCIRFIPGYTFKLDRYLREEANNKRHLLTEVAHHGWTSQADLDTGAIDPRHGVANAFSIAPRRTTYRPTRRTPKPTINGLQTAVVTGPKGQEIYTDKYGRVKVQFHWDRVGQNDDGSSCWVRVNQFWTGQGWGYQWTPRIGNEVLVDFVDGDPDRPVVVGMLYNAQNVPPYPLPEEMTKSAIKSNSTPGGGGSNELRFEDKKGDEQFYTHAQKNQVEEVEENLGTTVGGSQGLSVGGDRGVKVGNDESVTIGANQTIKVGAKQLVFVGASQGIGVGSDRLLQVKANDKIVVGANQTTNIGGDRTVSVSGDSNLSASNVGIKAKSQVGIKGTIVTIEGTSVHIKETTFINDTVSIMRKNTEIEGNLTVKGGNIKLKGGIINIDGDQININGGTVTIMGKPIKLNC